VNIKGLAIITKTPEHAKQILKVLSIREIPDLIPKKALNQYV